MKACAGLSSKHRAVMLWVNNIANCCRPTSLQPAVRQVPLVNQIRFLHGWEPFPSPSEQFPELSELPRFQHYRIQKYNSVSQYGLFLVVLANLWFLTLHQAETVQIALMSWAFFFIIDDWAIIRDYSYALKGRVFGAHKLRIHVFNVLLIAVLVVTVLQEYTLVGAALSILPITVFVSWRYYWANRARTTEQAEPEQPQDGASVSPT